MEAFSLLKFLRVGAGAGKQDSDTIVTHTAVDSDSDSDDGPFFDLELAEDSDPNREDNASNCADDGGGTDGEYKFAISSSGSSSSGDEDDRTDQNLSLSPSMDDLFFKGRLVPVEPEPNSKFPVSFIKSATKFRVLMMGFKKSKQSTKTEPNKTESKKTEPNKTEQETESKKTEHDRKPPGAAAERRFFTVKFKFEEVPIMSLFTKDHGNSRSSESQKQSIAGSSEPAVSDERLSKDTMQKYLRKVKPLYVRVSRRYGEKPGFSGQLSIVSGSQEPPLTAAPENDKIVKQRNLTAGLRVVSKHLGKSWSTVTVAPEKPAVPRRRDDSLLQQQDGIQCAILHCKRSFNASRDPSSSSLATKCASDTETDGEKTIEPSKEEEA